MRPRGASSVSRAERSPAPPSPGVEAGPEVCLAGTRRGNGGGNAGDPGEISAGAPARAAREPLRRRARRRIAGALETCAGGRVVQCGGAGAPQAPQGPWLRRRVGAPRCRRAGARYLGAGGPCVAGGAWGPLRAPGARDRPPRRQSSTSLHDRDPPWTRDPRHGAVRATRWRPRWPGEVSPRSPPRHNAPGSLGSLAERRFWTSSRDWGP